jgi:hypothetical protein
MATSQNKNFSDYENVFGKEHYTSFYDETNSDLKPFNYDIITSVNEFYLYRKISIDFLLRIFLSKDLGMQHRLTYNMIYMQFLMYEKARQAAGALVDKGPSRTSTLVTILASELTLYPYLYERFKDDPRGDRLKRRKDCYHRDVDRRLSEIVVGSKDKSNSRDTAVAWEKTLALTPLLFRSYKDMCKKLGCYERAIATIDSFDERMSAG